MTMEKRGVVEPGRTPPDSTLAKPDKLEDHPTTRLAKAAEEGSGDKSISANSKPEKDAQ